jgi:hypothetical protein
MNIIDLLSTSEFKCTRNTAIQVGYIDKNRDIFIKRLSHFKTGIYAIDALERQRREIQANKTTTVLLNDANAFLNNILDKTSKELHLHPHKKEKEARFNF